MVVSSCYVMDFKNGLFFLANLINLKLIVRLSPYSSLIFTRRLKDWAQTRTDHEIYLSPTQKIKIHVALAYTKL